VVIRSNREAAAAVAAAGAGWSVFLAVIGLLLGTPQVIVGVVPLVGASAFAGAFLMLPVSLSLEGAEVVYRSGRNEKRLLATEVARCAQVGRVWAFSSPTGAWLLALNRWQFRDTDVAAFCTGAGIAWGGPSMQPVERLRRDLRSARLNSAIGAVTGAGFVIFMGLSAWSQATARDDLARYDAAPPCTQVGVTSSGCRLETQARVTSVDAYKSDAALHLTLIPGAGDYRTRLSYPSPKVGDIVGVEVWNGRITLIGERATSSNPTSSPNLSINGVIAGFGLFSLVGFGLATWGLYQLVTTRRRLRAASNSG
jgi:hypothetical protein